MELELVKRLSPNTFDLTVDDRTVATIIIEEKTSAMMIIDMSSQAGGPRESMIIPLRTNGEIE